MAFWAGNFRRKVAFRGRSVSLRKEVVSAEVYCRISAVPKQALLARIEMEIDVNGAGFQRNATRHSTLFLRMIGLPSSMLVESVVRMTAYVAVGGVCCWGMPQIEATCPSSC